MSEILPTDNSPAWSQPVPFAFRSMNGRQEGQIFALDAIKIVLQFEAASHEDSSPPSRCLVIQGLDGVTVRTIQGEIAVNDQIQQDAWMSENDELSCGNARLRLIRQVETRQVIDDDLEHDSRSEAIHEPNSPESENPATGRFFSPFASDDVPEESAADGSTMCLSPGDLQRLFEPTVYGAEDVGYVDSSTLVAPSAEAPQMSPESTLDLANETCNLSHTETEQSEPTGCDSPCIEDFLLVPPESEPSQPPHEQTLIQASDVYEEGPKPCREPLVHIPTNVFDVSGGESRIEWIQYVVGLLMQEELTEQETAPLPLPCEVHGVIVH